ncbi:hypothetical protein J2W56_004265 [Nocardia kruczakiae]|uniref:DUF4236 domain-containing protein n=1 Tax=Nocardia kruczakiae TaxID=261477 RepID=A0ABU1XJ53_9NOCA|nr:DUF4236 domain-containing protein [Nocardia kruczakiae]MDR7170514.1 hypothetical protein [Nocardia kruczakiae]
MAQFRKSKKFGPVRITASKKGLGVSAGAGPVRVGIGADGKVRRTVRLPGTGINDTKVVGQTAKPTKPRAQATPQPQPEARPEPPPPAPRDIQPLTLQQPITAKGHNGTITFDGWWIDIKRAGMAAKLGAKINGYDSKRIPLNYLARIEWKQPSALINGYLKFVVIGEDSRSNGATAAAANPNAVLVTRQQVKRFEPLRTALSQALSDKRTTTTIQAESTRSALADVGTTTAARHPQVANASPPPAAPAGWYPDTAHPAILRWWDGTAWTERTAPS